MDTTAIIQFIGIVLFSSQVSNDPGVHAILPRIGHEHEALVWREVRDDLKTNANLPGVEDHAAVILYRKRDRLHSVGGWKADGKLKSDWEFVRLNGEHVQFLTNGTNAAASIPTTLPRLAASHSCLAAATPARLQPSFQAPYKGAAGVIDIPAGRLDVCASNTPSVTERVDTRLLLDTKGVLVIAATKTGETAKTISLDGDAVVYVANVPPYYLFTGKQTHLGDPHWEAYNEMLDSACASPPERPEALVAEECDLREITESYRIARKDPPVDFQMINSECSNTQWP